MTYRSATINNRKFHANLVFFYVKHYVFSSFGHVRMVIDAWKLWRSVGRRANEVPNASRVYFGYERI